MQYLAAIKVTTRLFVQSTDTVSDLLLVLLNRAATLSLTVSRGIMKVTQGKGEQDDNRWEKKSA